MGNGQEQHRLMALQWIVRMGRKDEVAGIWEDQGQMQQWQTFGKK